MFPNFKQVSIENRYSLGTKTFFANFAREREREREMKEKDFQGKNVKRGRIVSNRFEGLMISKEK